MHEEERRGMSKCAVSCYAFQALPLARAKHIYMAGRSAETDRDTRK